MSWRLVDGIAGIGRVRFAADYVIKSFAGNNVTVEVGLPEPKVTLDAQVEKDQIGSGRSVRWLAFARSGW